jgi:hypothetical protein
MSSEVKKINGWQYLEKFFQLVFCLPEISSTQVENLMKYTLEDENKVMLAFIRNFTTLNKSTLKNMNINFFNENKKFNFNDFLEKLNKSGTLFENMFKLLTNERDLKKFNKTIVNSALKNFSVIVDEKVIYTIRNGSRIIIENESSILQDNNNVEALSSSNIKSNVEINADRNNDQNQGSSVDDIKINNSLNNSIVLDSTVESAEQNIFEKV